MSKFVAYGELVFDVNQLTAIKFELSSEFVVEEEKVKKYYIGHFFFKGKDHAVTSKLNGVTDVTELTLLLLKGELP